MLKGIIPQFLNKAHVGFQGLEYAKEGFTPLPHELRLRIFFIQNHSVQRYLPNIEMEGIGYIKLLKIMKENVEA